MERRPPFDAVFGSGGMSCFECFCFRLLLHTLVPVCYSFFPVLNDVSFTVIQLMCVDYCLKAVSQESLTKPDEAISQA